MWKTSFSCIELEYLVHSICKSTIHFTTRTNICTMLIHLTKTGHKLAFNSCTCIIHTIICGSSTRIVWVVSVVLHIPLNSLYTVSFFFVCLTCEYDRIPCNDGDNLPHKHCMVDRNCNCSGAADSNVFWYVLQKHFTACLAFYERKKTKQNKIEWMQ